MKKVLIIGGGVAGSTAAYMLKNKNYDVTILDQNTIPGGLARTCYYAGHPYEFGPHIWFWPGGPENPINKLIVDLTDNELYYIDRKLFSYIHQDQKKYRYPVHFNEIPDMPEKNKIYDELKAVRDDNWKLKEEKLPKIGDCTFEEYFATAIGKTLYGKFMENYTHKMWNIPGDSLQTSMVWADRFNHAYSKNKDGKTGLEGYDPLKFEDHTLGKGIRFQIYPKKGWNDVWGTMAEGCNWVQDSVVSIKDEDKNAYLLTGSGEKYYFSDYKYVINTIDLDTLYGEDTLKYTGRMMIPLLLPDLGTAFPQGAESLHFSGAEFQTRVTEMKVITRHESKDTLILIEVPVLPGAGNYFPANTIEFAKANNLFAEKAYPQQSKEAMATHSAYMERSKKIKNLHHTGRHSEFKYWGMPETVNSAYNLGLELE